MALNEVGCAVVALFPARGHSLSKTSAVQRSFCYNSLNPLGSLRRAITACNPDLIIPCDDLAVQHLHGLYESASTRSDPSNKKIADLIELSIGSPDGYFTTTARYELMSLAQELGVPVPETALIERTSDLDAYKKRQFFPWVLKVDGTWGGHGVKIVKNIQEAKEAFRKMSVPLGALPALKRLIVNRDPYSLRPWITGSRPRVTVQSYIQGRPANSAIASAAGKVLAEISVEVIAAISATGCSSVVRAVENRQITKASEQIAGRLGLSGFHGFDFMIESNSGIAYLIEMNPRCTPLCHLQLGSGRDLVSALCAEMTGKPPVSRALTTNKAEIAFFPQAWHWNPKSALLRTSYHDVPWQEPALVEDLIRLPWPDRSLFARLSNHVRHLTFEQRALQSVLFSDSAEEESAAYADDCDPLDGSCLQGPDSAKQNARV